MALMQVVIRCRSGAKKQKRSGGAGCVCTPVYGGMQYRNEKEGRAVMQWWELRRGQGGSGTTVLYAPFGFSLGGYRFPLWKSSSNTTRQLRHVYRSITAVVLLIRRGREN